MPKPKPVLTVREVADTKGVSLQAVRTAVERGTLNAYRSGGSILIRHDKALAAYLAAPPATNRKTDG
jgi:excisionase family DNA binding protein